MLRRLCSCTIELSFGCKRGRIQLNWYSETVESAIVRSRDASRQSLVSLRRFLSFKRRNTMSCWLSSQTASLWATVLYDLPRGLTTCLYSIHLSLDRCKKASMGFYMYAASIGTCASYDTLTRTVTPTSALIQEPWI